MGRHPIPGGDDLLLFVPLTEAEQNRVALPAGARWSEKHPGGRRGMRFAKGAGAKIDFRKVHSDQPLSISFWVRAPDQLVSTTILEQVTKVPVPLTEEQKKKDPKAKPKQHDLGWKITTSTQGALTFTVYDGKGGSIQGLLAGEEALTPRQWQHVCVRYSGGRSDTAITVVVNGENRRLRNSTQSYIDPVDLANVPVQIGRSLPSGGLSDIRIFQRWLTGAETQVLADEFRLRDLLANRKPQWTALKSPGSERMLSRYHSNWAQPEPTTRAHWSLPRPSSVAISCPLPFDNHAGHGGTQGRHTARLGAQPRRVRSAARRSEAGRVPAALIPLAGKMRHRIASASRNGWSTPRIR